ncbi:MAG: hypothetical protein WC734_05925 [Patescibacteria group bacterium]|jgi:hypothetical protein
MAIYDNTWSSNEKVTSAKLNQMYANEVNSTDDIHPQYNKTKMYLLNTIYDSSFNQSSSGSVGIYGTDINTPAGIYIPYLPNITYGSLWSTTGTLIIEINTINPKTVANAYTKLKVDFSGYKYLPSGDHTAIKVYMYYLLSGYDGSVVSEGATEITSTGDYAAYSQDIAITSLSAVEPANLKLFHRFVKQNTNDANIHLLTKSIKIYPAL